MAQAAPAAPPVVAAPTTTYFELFGDASNDSMNGHLQVLLQPYRDFNVTPATVKNIALSGRQGQPPVTYFFVAYHRQTEKLQAYINPSTYTASPIHPTQHDGTNYIQVGDLMDQQFSLAIWPRSMYHQSNNMLVPTAAQLDNLIAADPNAKLFGPFMANDPNAELIRTRYCCMVPTAYVPLVMDQTHTPKELWTTLRGAIANDNLEQECEPLLNYLRACITRPAVNQLSTLALEAENLPTVVALDPDLIAHRRRILVEDFPHLSSAVSQAQVNMVSQGIHALTQEVHLTRVETREQRDRDRNKTFESSYPASYQKLLRYAQAPNGAALQPMWNMLAKSKKGDRIRVLSQYLELAKQQLDLIHVKTEVTPGMLEKIFNLVFHPPSVNHNFGDYFNSFVLDTESSQAVQQATLYETLYSGTAAPSLTDVQELASIDMKAAADIVGYQNTLQKLVIFHQCMWGGIHPVTASLSRYLRLLNQKTMELQIYQSGCKSQDKLLFYPRLQFKLQIKLDYYFEMSSHPNVQPEDLPALRMDTVFQELRLHQQWEPDIGLHFLEQLGLTNVITFQPPPLPPDTGSSNPSEGAPENRTITNPTFNASLFNAYRESRVGARAVREKMAEAGIELPSSQVDSTKPICLAYHTRGRCNTACRLAFDHVAYTASQYAPLVQFCTTNWPQ